METIIKLAEQKGYERTYEKENLVEIILIQFWLMEKHNIHVNPVVKLHYPDNGITDSYYCEVNVNFKGDVGDDGVYDGYIGALKHGIEIAFEILNKKQ